MGRDVRVSAPSKIEDYRVEPSPSDLWAGRVSAVVDGVPISVLVDAEMLANRAMLEAWMRAIRADADRPLDDDEPS
jgi:hypothetical protein